MSRRPTRNRDPTIAAYVTGPNLIAKLCLIKPGMKKRADIMPISAIYKQTCYSLAEAARIAGVTVPAIRLAISTGRLDAIESDVVAGAARPMVLIEDGALKQYAESRDYRRGPVSSDKQPMTRIRAEIAKLSKVAPELAKKLKAVLKKDGAK